MEKEHLKILLEDIKGKFELVLEGHEVLRREIQDTKQELREEISLVNVKLEALSTKIDSVAADLSAHRRDTEAHSPLYKIKEDN